MTTENGEALRTNPRVDYRADVEIWPKGAAYPSPAQSLNLGPGGILLQTETDCAVGTRLSCAIPLSGGFRHIKGRVIRKERRHASQSRVAVRFEDLPEADLDELRSLVRAAAADERFARVRFAGVEGIRRARATLIDEGVRLFIAQPAPAIGADAEIWLVGAPAETGARESATRKIEKLAGKVSEVFAEITREGSQSLVIDVAVAAAPLASPLSAAGGADQPLKWPLPGVTGQEPATRRPRTGSATPPTRTPVRARTAAGAAEPPSRLQALRDATTGVWPFAVLSFFIVLMALSLADRKMLGRLDAGITEIKAELASIQTALGALYREVAAAPNPVTAPNPSALTPAATPEVTVTAAAGSTLVSVPITGSAHGWSYYSITGAGRGVVVRLPHALSLLPLGNHWINRDGVRLVRINQHERGLEIRTFFMPDRLAHEEMLEVVSDAPAGAVNLRLRRLLDD